jgi:hypothetical protein
VVVSGSLAVVSEHDRDRVLKAVEVAWPPELIERAVAEIETEV